MCRSIKLLRDGAAPLPDAQVREAALQFVRKISGYRHPSQANTEAFEQAVDDIASVSTVLLDSLVHRRVASR